MGELLGGGQLIRPAGRLGEGTPRLCDALQADLAGLIVQSPVVATVPAVSTLAVLDGVVATGVD